MEDLYLFKHSPRMEFSRRVSGDITYTAEAPPETSHMVAGWIVTRTEMVDTNTTVVRVLQGLQIPGTNGAGLAALFGD